MNKRLAILSQLLRYPGESLRADLPDITRAIPMVGFQAELLPKLLRLSRRLAQGDGLDREEEYVRLFDRGRGTSLHLFEHVHGDTRNRGPAMIELARVYDDAGFAMDARELPDFLPLLLEFCAVAPPEITGNLLTQCAPILEQLHTKLLGRSSGEARLYAVTLAAILAEVGLRPQHRPSAENEQTDTEFFAELDAAYAEEPVVFGPESDPDKAGARARVSAMIERLRKLRSASAITR